MDAKPLLKEALQAEVGLPVDRSIPLIGFIGRLEEQKGSDILVAALHKFIGMNIQVVILVSNKNNPERSYRVSPDSTVTILLYILGNGEEAV